MIPERYISADRVERTNYYQVGTAWDTKSGEGLSVKLAPGVSVSGDLLILPRKARQDAQQPDGGLATEDDDIPFA
jgi:hypothetical protein